MTSVGVQKKPPQTYLGGAHTASGSRETCGLHLNYPEEQEWEALPVKNYQRKLLRTSLWGRANFQLRKVCSARHLAMPVWGPQGPSPLPQPSPPAPHPLLPVGSLTLSSWGGRARGSVHRRWDSTFSCHRVSSHWLFSQPKEPEHGKGHSPPHPAHTALCHKVAANKYVWCPALV